MTEVKKKKPYSRVAILGVMSLASYYVLFTHSSIVMEYFIKGGFYAALPIVTALYFSFVHGAFASGVLSLLGFSAKGH